MGKLVAAEVEVVMGTSSPHMLCEQGRSSNSRCSASSSAGWSTSTYANTDDYMVDVAMVEVVEVEVPHKP